MSRLASVSIACLIVASAGACASPTPSSSAASGTPGLSATPTPSTTSPSTTTTTAAAPATASVTLAPLSPTISPSSAPGSAAGVYVSQPQLIAWKPTYNTFVSYMIVAQIINRSSTWIEVNGQVPSSYTIYDRDGLVTMTADFPFAYPDYLAPGATGYLIDDGVNEDLAMVDFGTVDIDAKYSDYAGTPTLTFTTSNIDLRAQAFPAVVEATGEVTNTGSASANGWHAAAIYFGTGGNIIGASLTSLIGSLDPGQKLAFETVGSNPVTLRNVDSYVVIASSNGDS